MGALRVHLGEGEADTVVEHLDPHHVASRASADVAGQLQALLVCRQKLQQGPAWRL